MASAINATPPEHLFPDNDGLGLPNWCPRGTTPWPREGYQWVRARVLAMRAWSLTDTGRRFMARHHKTVLGHYAESELDDHTLDELRTYAEQAGARPPQRVPRTPTRTRSLAALIAETRKGEVYPLRAVVSAIDRLDPEEASTTILKTLERVATWSRDAMDGEAIAVYIRAAFARRLAWTTQAAPGWWPDLLPHLLSREPMRHALVHLPPPFFSADARQQLIATAHDYEHGLEQLYHPDSTAEDVRVLIDSFIDSHERRRSDALRDRYATELVAHLTHRHDLPTLAPDLLPVLLGHRRDSLAELGLRLATQHTVHHPLR